MTRFKKLFGLFLPVLMLMTMLTGNAQAALLDFGPIVPEVLNSTQPNIGHGFPAWFRDTNRVPLQMCLDEVGGCLFAAADRPNPAQPASFPANLPDELFYYSATATMTTSGGEALLFAGVEMNFFNNGPNDFEQVGFSRVRVRFDSTIAGDYTVTTPWKQYHFTVTAADIAADGGRRVVNATEDIGLRADGDFAGVITGNIGPYGYSQGAPFVTAAGAYLGDGTPRVLLGTPNNIFRIEGPPGFTTVSTNLFAVTGKLYVDPIATPLAVDKLTYARDAAGVQVNAFATTNPLANPRNTTASFPLNFALSGVPSALQVSGTDLPTQGMTTNNPADGKFFSTTGVFAFQGNLPAEATVTNTADIPNIAKTVPLVDEVKITNATYNPLNSTLTVAAQSLDTVANPTLTVSMPGMTAPLGTISNGQSTVTFPVNDNSGPTQKTFNAPPQTITVTSAEGGSATVPVITFIPVTNPPNIAPTQAGPSGNNVSNSPTFSWSAVPEASEYVIYLYDGTTATAIGPIFTSAAANCASGVGECSVTLPDALISGHPYFWTVKGQNIGGAGPNAEGMHFVVATPPAAAPTQVSPVGTGIPINPVFTWNAVLGASDYTMYLFNGTTATEIGPTFTATAANCPTGTGQCSVTLPNALISGNPYFWTVRAQNNAGASPYAAGMHLVIATSPTTAPTQVSPSGAGIPTNPVFIWDAVADAADYVMYLFDGTTGTATGPTFSVTAANCPTGTGQCSVTIPLISGHPYFWAISARNSAGASPYSAGLHLTVQ